MVTEDPLFRPLLDGRWILHDDWVVRVRYRKVWYKFIVPKGFVSDLGSIPTALEWIVENDRYVRAFVLHDYLYHAKTLSRNVADAIMYQMIAEHDEVIAWVAWAAVRMFGGFAWRAC